MPEDYEPEFDEERISELMKEYQETCNRRERRELETEVLSETVWKSPALGPHEILVTRQELDSLLDSLIEAVEEGNQERISYLRRLPSFMAYMEDL